MEKTYAVLVADDDRAIVNILQTVLSDAGYRVMTAFTGTQAQRLARTEQPDLVILDVMMPGGNGLLAAADIRAHSNVPILMLSAKAEGSDRVLGLEAGADDYLVKPFYKQELLARVRALLRRFYSLGAAPDCMVQDARLRVGDLLLDPAARSLTVRGEAVHLTPTEFRILRLLMANPNRVFSAEEIYERVWESDAYAVENTVMVHISRLREKLELNPKKPEYLKVVWGVGYVLEAPKNP